MLDEIKSIVRGKDLCVLATASGNSPHCSLMAYAANNDCTEIYMVTHANTRKYKNIRHNPRVCLLIDTRDEDSGLRRPYAKALTVNGECETVRDDKRKHQIHRILIHRHPHLKEFANHDDAEILSVLVRSFVLLDGLTDAHFETVS